MVRSKGKTEDLPSKVKAPAQSDASSRMKRSKGVEKYPVPVAGDSVLEFGDGGLDAIVELA